MVRSGNIVCNSINSILHICFAHIMHRFSHKVQRKGSLMANKSTKKVFMYVMARLTICTHFEELDKIFTAYVYQVYQS